MQYVAQKKTKTNRKKTHLSINNDTFVHHVVISDNILHAYFRLRFFLNIRQINDKRQSILYIKKL